MVFTVLIHDCETLDTGVQRTRFTDIDNPGVEITAFSGNPLIDRIGNDMGDTTPVPRLRCIGLTNHLLTGKDIPQAKFDLQRSVLLYLYPALNKGLRIQSPPVCEARLHIQRFSRLDEGFPVNGLEQPGPGKVGSDDSRHIRTGKTVAFRGTAEIGHRDRHRLYLSAGDVDTQFSNGLSGHQRQRDE